MKSQGTPMEMMHVTKSHPPTSKLYQSEGILRNNKDHQWERTSPTSKEPDPKASQMSNKNGNPSTAIYLELETTTTNGRVFGHCRGGNGMECRTGMIFIFPGLPRCMHCG
jgi:hypothetical protein